MLAPVLSVTKMSRKEASNPTDDVSSTRDSDGIGHCAMKPSTWSAMAACATGTPLGVPVEPDVYIT